LTIHPVKSQLFEAKQGANFVGFRVLGDPSGTGGVRLKVRSENLRRGRRRLKHMQRLYRLGKITQTRFNLSLESWFAHLAHAHTWYLRQKIIASLQPN